MDKLNKIHMVVAALRKSYLNGSSIECDEIANQEGLWVTNVLRECFENPEKLEQYYNLAVKQMLDEELC